MRKPLLLIRLIFAAWLLCVAGSIGAAAAGLTGLTGLAGPLETGMWLCYVAGFALRFRFGAAATSPLLPALPKGGRVVVFGLVALLVFFALPPALRLLDPTAGGFAPDTINAAALGAFQYFAALSMAYVSWRWLFPGLYAYAAECMEGKLLENLTDELKQFISADGADLFKAAELRHIAQLQFLIRCVRFVFALSPFLFFLLLANHALTAALTAVPGAAPAL